MSSYSEKMNKVENSVEYIKKYVKSRNSIFCNILRIVLAIALVISTFNFVYYFGVIGFGNYPIFLIQCVIGFAGVSLLQRCINMQVKKFELISEIRDQLVKTDNPD